MRAGCTDSEFINLFNKLGATQTAKSLNINVRNVHARRRRLENLHGAIPGPQTYTFTDHPGRLKTEIPDGIVVIGSDAHYWPGLISTAHKALIAFCKEFKPKAVIMNGDMLDGASISRHPPIGWETRPSLIEEIDTVKERLTEIVSAVPKSCELYWTLGNHDARFETRLATVAPEYARVHGVHLKDHFPEWIPAWSVWINEKLVVKHRLKGGPHAPHGNTSSSGKSIATGHLHALNVTAYTDYNGTRYGIDTGTLADPFGPQFNDYCEDNPVNWRSGFAICTFKDGQLLWPELVNVIDKDKVQFRGKVHKV